MKILFLAVTHKTRGGSEGMSENVAANAAKLPKLAGVYVQDDLGIAE